MKTWCLLALALVACGEVATGSEPAEVEAPAPQWASYGESFEAAGVVQASALLDTPADYVDRSVVVEGRVADVCQKAGCWMVIADGERTMRVRMKDHAFSVAKDGAGSTCQVAGTVVATPIDPDTVAHFESEASEGAPIPEHAAEDVVYEIIATGVRLKPSS